MAKGTRFGQIHGPKLNELFMTIRNLPYQIEHKQTLFKGGNWYIIFTVQDDNFIRAANDPDEQKALLKPKKFKKKAI